MNFTTALMGLTLFASINTFTMNRDIDQARLAEYILACGICGKKMNAPYESIKKVFHSACIMTMANAPYITCNPIVAENETPWATNHTNTADTTAESISATANASSKERARYAQNRRKHWSQ